MGCIFDLTKRSIAISQKGINVKRNKVQYMIQFFTDFDLTGEVESFKESLAELIIVTAGKYPIIAQELQEHISKY